MMHGDIINDMMGIYQPAIRFSLEQKTRLLIVVMTTHQFEPEGWQINGSPEEKCWIGHGGKIPLRSQPVCVVGFDATLHDRPLDVHFYAAFFALSLFLERHQIDIPIYFNNTVATQADKHEEFARTKSACHQQ